MLNKESIDLSLENEPILLDKNFNTTAQKFKNQLKKIKTPVDIKLDENVRKFKFSFGNNSFDQEMILRENGEAILLWSSWVEVKTIRIDDDMLRTYNYENIDSPNKYLLVLRMFEDIYLFLQHQRYDLINLKKTIITKYSFNHERLWPDSLSTVDREYFVYRHQMWYQWFTLQTLDKEWACLNQLWVTTSPTIRELSVKKMPKKELNKKIKEYRDNNLPERRKKETSDYARRQKIKQEYKEKYDNTSKVIINEYKLTDPTQTLIVIDKWENIWIELKIRGQQIHIFGETLGFVLLNEEEDSWPESQYDYKHQEIKQTFVYPEECGCREFESDGPQENIEF